jgi:hypothetical protein
MILVDLNQVLLSGLMAQISNKKGVVLEESLVRHMILNILRMHIRNFRKEYGEVVLCCDNRKYWRKDYFPFYKASRKKSREKSSLDWHMIFEMLAKFKLELKENFPYKVIDVEGAENLVIFSLTKKVEVLCFEWAREFHNITRQSIDHLLKIGFKRFCIQYEDDYSYYPKEEDFIKDLKILENRLTNVGPNWGMVWAI